MTNRSPRRPYSLKKRIFLVFLGTYAMFTAVSLILGLSIYRILSSRTEESYTKYAENLVRQIDSDLSNIHSFVLATMINNNELGLLKTETSTNRLYFTRTRFMNYLKSYTPSLSSAEGIFFYVPATDSFISAVNKDSPVPSRIRDCLRTDGATGSCDLSPGETSRWFFTNIDSTPCITRCTTYSGITGGSWISLSWLLQHYSGDFASDHIILFADPESGALFSTAEGLDSFTFIPEQKRCKATVNGKTLSFLQISAHLDNCKETLVVLVPTSRLRGDLRKYNLISITLITVLLAGFIIFYLLIRRHLSEPVNDLRTISKALREGLTDDESAMSMLMEEPRSLEIKELYGEVSMLTDQIASLKSRVLREQLAKNNYELLSLRNQVSPHFLINCLSALSSLNNTGTHQAEIKTLISLLASHLRYTLSTKSMVSIQEEVRHLTDYYEMMKIRYPRSLAYSIHVLDLCHDAAIVPGLIIMLSENSIKHNLEVGEFLHISVEAEEEYINGKHCVHITHKDSGKGFPDDLLEKLNDLDNATPDFIADGTKVGLYNIVKRLYLAYPENSAKILFSNRPEGGAGIEIIIPYIPYQES